MLFRSKQLFPKSLEGGEPFEFEDELPFDLNADIIDISDIDYGIWYVDAMEEALCFGWIDSTTKKLSDNCTIQRLTPRQKNSAWSELNKERCRRMERMGRMTDAGRDCCPDMSGAGFVIDTEILAALKSDPEVWANFQSFPPLYRRVRIDTIQINRRMRRPELFKKRLDKFIENTRKGIMYGEWNDNGRLL